MADPSIGAPPIGAPLGDVESERLSLRRISPGDLDELAALSAQEEVWRFPYGRGLTRDETRTFVDAQVRDWDEVGFGLWVARPREGGAAIGVVGVSVPRFLPAILPAVEVGWRFAPSAWGRGYATEGAAAALDEAFTTLGLDSVCSLPQADNPQSARVAERLGMTLLGEVTIPANERRGQLTALHYVIDREAWTAQRRR
jgi:RimJ/RimL family protein N-acetyltransferase